MSAYMEKATKEAKVHTSWVAGNRAYDRATTAFVEQTLGGPTARRFLDAFLPFQQRVARAGVVNSLAQVVLRDTAPGVPDLYRGTEVWDLTLVDPDNRRPVDFERRAELLATLPLPERPASSASARGAAAIADLLDRWPDGRIKLFVNARTRLLRREHPDLFAHGDYLPLETDITVGAGLVGYARRLEDRAVLVVVPRLATRLAVPERPWPLGADAWKTSRVFLPPGMDGPLTNLLTGESVRPSVQGSVAWLVVADVLRVCPVALLWAEA
jgi:(1->4)-alpha-D-glucan 1-alpha-D-glucosylmutase